MLHKYNISTRVYPYPQSHLSSTKINLNNIEDAAQTTLQHRDAPNNSTVSLILSTDAYLQELNNKYAGNNITTDVLSFPSNDETDYLGDVILSTEYANRTARLNAYELTEELQLLTIHGILHLLGYKHETQHERQIMWNIQNEILSKLDIHINHYYQ